MNQRDPDRLILEVLAEEFLAEHRAGQAPRIEEFAARLPDQQGEALSFLEAVLEIEALKPHHGIRPRPSPPPRFHLGDYEIRREIGRGGMGVVYEADQISLSRRVALKILPVDFARDPSAVERFRREAGAAARLHHTHIVPVFDLSEHDGLYFYAMQFIEGESVHELVARVSRDEETSSLSGRQVAEIGLQVASALQHAHEHGIVHRDIKPGNLLVDGLGQAWVTDFGLVKTEGSDLTRSGDLVGTLKYMAPERFRGRCDALADVYSLGATLYEMLALQAPFAEVDQATLVQRIQETSPTPLRHLNPSVPRDLQTIVETAMAPDPADRYRSARALENDLQRFLDDRPILARRPSVFERLHRWTRRNRALAAGVVTLFVVLICSSLALGVAASYTREQRDRERLERQETEWHLYRATMSLAEIAARSPDGAPRVRELLDEAEPEPGQPDRRGWEWDYLHTFADAGDHTVVRELDTECAPREAGTYCTLDWHPEQTHVIASALNSSSIVDLETGQLVKIRGGRGHWNPKGSRIAAAYLENFLIHTASGELVYERTFPSEIHDVGWWGEPAEVLVLTSKNLWRIAPEPGSEPVLVQELPPHYPHWTLRMLAETPQEPLALVIDEGRLLRCNLLRSEKPELIGSTQDTTYSLSWSPSRRWAATGGRQHFVELWDLETNTRSAILRGPTFHSNSITWSPHEDRVAASSLDGTVSIWDLESGDLVLTLYEGREVLVTSWTPDGTTLATWLFDGTLRLRRAEVP